MANDNSTTEEDGDQYNENAYNENANDHRDRSDNLSTQRCRKVQSLFQIMYHVHHIMNAESVHNLGRGGKIPSKHKTSTQRLRRWPNIV